MYRGKFVVSSIVGLFFTATLCAHASPQSGALSDQSAKAIVSEYKELRTQCAAASGLERKDCYAKLNAANEKYGLAKKYLSNADGQGTDSAHYVSLAY